MDGRLRPEMDAVVVGGNARERFYDSRGYGRPARGDDPVGAGGLVLSRVEAAHLLYRGDLEAVRADGRAMGFRAFLVRAGAAGADGADGDGDRDHGFLARYLTYADLRDRGFYLSPAREGWPGGGRVDPLADFAVYERGHGPGEGAVAYRVRAVGERAVLRVADLDGVLAVVDEESDVTYFESDRAPPEGEAGYGPPAAGADADLLADRAVCWSPPDGLYGHGFFGQPLAGHGPDALQLSLVEAAYLAARGTIALGGDTSPRDGTGEDADDELASPPPTLPGVDAAGVDATGAGSGDGGPAGADAAGAGTASAGYRAAVARGRAVEGERFDRRLSTYAACRALSLVPKTGFKFGADFRTYADVESVDSLGHSEALVRALPAEATLTPRDIALDIRLAHGVRKRMTFALVGDPAAGPGDDAEGGDGRESADGAGTGGGEGPTPISWRSVSRLTP